MFMSHMGGAMLTEDGRLDDETLSKETGRRLPNMNIEDPSRRIWIFTTARCVGVVPIPILLELYCCTAVCQKLCLL